MVPHTFPWIKRATEQRAAARFPLLSVPRHATQRKVHAQRTLASTLSAPGGRPMLRPGALLSMSLCLLVQRSSGCAQLSMCSSCRVLAHRTRRGTHFVRNGMICIGMIHSVASNSPLKPTGHPSDRVGRRRGQRAISRFRVPAEVYAGASYLNTVGIAPSTKKWCARSEFLHWQCHAMLMLSVQPGSHNATKTRFLKSNYPLGVA